MSQLKLKNNVRPLSLVIAAAVINSANEMKLDTNVFITSGNDSKHMPGSKHYSNEALDVRSKNFNISIRNKLIKIINRRLGKNYQVIMEDDGKPNEHIHIEYDPK